MEPARTFQSKFELNGKLKRCRAIDADHIGETTLPALDRQGEHVALIQEALNNWAFSAGGRKDLVIKGTGITERRFGPETAKSVVAFKTKLDIKNYQNKIDPIVGKNTIKWLDDYMPYFPIRPLAPWVGFTDFVVRLIGGRDQEVVSNQEVFANADLRRYIQPMRALVKIGRGTRLIRGEGEGQIATVVARIKAVKDAQTEDSKLDVVCLYGSSAGGRNIIEVARRLTAAQIHINYVGVADAAFFDDDTSPPTAADRFGHPRTPTFNGAGVTADSKQNFFQTWGNKVTYAPSRGRLIWTSTGKDEKGEIHGEVSGFVPHNKDNDIAEW